MLEYRIGKKKTAKNKNHGLVADYSDKKCDKKAGLSCLSISLL